LPAQPDSARASRRHVYGSLPSMICSLWIPAKRIGRS
jgi:hypothetical protein